MSLPNVVIVGAPKCGTSSIFTWLTDHPEVCGARVKETFYLMDSGHPKLKQDSNFHDHGLDGYKNYFDHCQGHKIVVEATTHYIYQQTSLEVLSSLTPTPHIIFVLRKPSERIYSSFQYTQNNLANLDKDITFSEFIAMIRNGSIKALSTHFTSPTNAYVLTRDIKYSQYIDYILLWLTQFDQEYIHIFLFEVMKKNPYAFMYDLATRIGLEPSFYQTYDFTKKNETFYIRNQPLYRQARKVARLIPQNLIKHFLKRAYLKVQAKPAGVQRTLEDQTTLMALDHYFQPFNQRLAHELDVDISIWE